MKTQATSIASANAPALERFVSLTREALALVVDTSIGGGRMARELDALIARRGKPAFTLPPGLA